MYVITSVRGWEGVADFPDEAMDFAARVAGVPRKDAQFTESGELLHHRIPTGWRVGILKEEAA